MSCKRLVCLLLQGVVFSGPCGFRSQLGTLCHLKKRVSVNWAPYWFSGFRYRYGRYRQGGPQSCQSFARCPGMQPAYKRFCTETGTSKRPLHWPCTPGTKSSVPFAFPSKGPRIASYLRCISQIRTPGPQSCDIFLKFGPQVTQMRYASSVSPKTPESGELQWCQPSEHMSMCECIK